jgi:hypothetical protein
MGNVVEKEEGIERQSDINKKLFLGIIFDIIGMSTYSFPLVGEIFDLIWAPISGILLAKMYKGKVGTIAGIFGFSEELLPFTDAIPTFTLTWIYVYVLKKK